MKKYGCLAVAVIGLILFLIFRTTPTVSDLIIDILYVHQISWLLVISTLVMTFISFYKADGAGYDESPWVAPAIAAVVLGIVWFVWLGIQDPIKMAALSDHTMYEDQNVSLVTQNEIRPYPYAIAAANIATAKYDGTTAAGDLDYVQDRWTASIDPNSFWVQLYRPTQGIFVMNNDYSVTPAIQPFTFSEKGILWNHAKSLIRSHEYFVEFSDVIYVRQGDGRYLAVTTLIKRAGFARYPYIYGVAVVSSEGLIEILPQSVAEADLRLQGIALVPFDFETARTEAYGWRNGVLNGIFDRTTRLTVHVSQVNAENASPFHLKSTAGNLWYTTLSPLGSSTESITTIAMSDSHDINGPVKIWRTEQTQSLPGTDFLASLIESAPNHLNLVWFHGGDKCGNAALLEMVPVVRQEAGGPKLYFMGYVSAVNVSSNVRFYSVIDPESRVVYEDLPSFEYVNRWLRGEYELNPVNENSVTIDPTTSQCLSPDLAQESDQVLIEYLRKITDELERRLQR
ncbi:MAG: hypothetical protein UW68_C0016G0012 [Candidatus Collierbacteria bacterium GW2011_GWB1_44_6]|uniref:Uncharacterized protein n=1 Tax=Candidatus Collierbacteria bacterium GW2011_GWB1_44_6 TaxID=1618384 RepID=A0A0G1LWE6_9BACT|nr:MAG: hypothetical protein UW68_C0016G0012 [Candidatus Collierbacteria bacterium GW2011_GWB1_44_6]KKT82969.1 MAG: hypothetical protein UW80_C0025G0002 [Microgenomates group bacterium GW2011_GWC1_44_9]